MTQNRKELITKWCRSLIILFLIIKASDNGQVAYISVVYSLCVWILPLLFYVSLFVEMQVIKLWNRLCTRLCFYFLSGWTERWCRPITCASALQPKGASLCVCAWGGLSRRCVCVFVGGGGVSVKLRFLIRRGIPEPGQSRHQTVHPLWRPNGGMRFGRRYVGGGEEGLSGKFGRKLE